MGSIQIEARLIEVESKGGWLTGTGEDRPTSADFLMVLTLQIFLNRAPEYAGPKTREYVKKVQARPAYKKVGFCFFGIQADSTADSHSVIRVWRREVHSIMSTRSRRFGALITLFSSTIVGNCPGMVLAFPCSRFERFTQGASSILVI